MSSLIANPAHFASQAPHNDVRQERVYRVAEVWYVVEGLRIVYLAVSGCALATILAAIIASVVAAGCTVEPHLKLVRTILGKLYTLREKYLLGIVVGIVAVGILLSPILAAEVPRRHIETILHLKLAGCLCKIAWNIGLAGILARRAKHAVCGGCCRPKAKSVVMLNHGDTSLHASRLGYTQPLGWVGQTYRGKCRRILGSVAPFLAGISIHTVVEEGIKLGLVPQQLTTTWNGKYGTWCVVGIGNTTLRQFKFGRLSLSQCICRSQ